ncbi:MAG: hypothetical protein ACOYX5_07920 [Actinomycetota bacterium]
MTSVLHDPGRPAGLSPTTRLIDGASALVTACGCDCAARSVTILRGFDADSRHRSKAVRDRLRRRGITARVTAAPVAATRDQLHGVHVASRGVPHVCVFVDATAGGRQEADRIAGWFGIPVVGLGQSAETQTHPLLRLGLHDTRPGDRRVFPSTAGEVVGVAFDFVAVLPNQPEKGSLRVRVGRDLPRDLPEGSAVRMAMLSGHVQVTTAEGAGQSRTWIADQVRVEQTSGVHTIHRDGLLVADLDGCLSVIPDPRGLVRHSV